MNEYVSQLIQFPWQKPSQYSSTSEKFLTFCSDGFGPVQPPAGAAADRGPAATEAGTRDVWPESLQTDSLYLLQYIIVFSAYKAQKPGEAGGVRPGLGVRVGPPARGGQIWSRLLKNGQVGGMGGLVYSTIWVRRTMTGQGLI